MVHIDVVLCIFSRAFGWGTYLLQDFGTSCRLRMMPSDDLMSSS